MVERILSRMHEVKMELNTYDFINFAAFEMHILSELRIMQIDLFAKCSSTEVCWTPEAAIAEIGIACEIRAAEISKSQEIAGCEVGLLAKRCITEGGINPEIGFFEVYAGGEMAVFKFGQITEPGS